MSLWLLLKTSTNQGCVLQLHPAPTKWGKHPRPFSTGAEGEKFDDFALYWVSDNPSPDSETWGTRWREPLDVNDALQRSALKSGALAYRLLYNHVDNPIRQQCTVRFQLDEAELLAQGGNKSISGASGDLLFALATVTAALPRTGGYPPLAATGALDEESRVQAIDGVPEKLLAYLAIVEKLPEPTPASTAGTDEQPKALFFYPSANDDALNPELRKTAHLAGVRMVAVEHLEEALSALGITVKDFWQGNPYRGFGFFDTAHRRIFFGRKTDSNAVCEELLKREKDGTPGILVIGSSGRGKSSLIRAGVIPDLQQHEDLLERPIFYHIWRLPQDVTKNDAAASEAALTNALRQAWAHLPELQFMASSPNVTTTYSDTHPLPLTTNPRDDSPLSALADELAAVLPQHRRFVWVIDQMEELFSLDYPAATIHAFGIFLKRLQKLGVWPIATLRSEYFHPYQNSLLLEVFGNGHTLPKMHETALELAIRGPAKLRKLDFETDPATGINLAAHIRDEALQGGEDMLPLLGFVLSELYEDPERVNNGWLTWEAYRRLGGLPSISDQPREQPSADSANIVELSRHTGMDCRYPCDRDVTLPIIPSVWVPAIPAETTNPNLNSTALVGNPDRPVGFLSKLLARLRRKEKPVPRQPVALDKPLQVGGLAGAVGHYADKLLSECSAEERDALPKVLLHLVRLSEDGKQALRQRARLNAFAAEPQQASLVRKLIDGRLLISNVDADTQEATVELVHDCLLTAWDKIGAAIEQHRELLQAKRKLSNAATHWERNGRPERLLISRPSEVMHAEVLVACLGSEASNPDIQDFLLQSIKNTRTAFRMLWILSSIIILIPMIYIVEAIGVDEIVDAIIGYDGLNFLFFIFVTLILSMPYFKAYRSLVIKPYLVTAFVDMLLTCLYSFVMYYPVYLFFIKPLDFGDPSILNFLNLFAAVAVVFPLISLGRGILLKYSALKAVKQRNITVLSKRIGLKFLAIDIVIWKKIEGYVWVLLLLYVVLTWNYIKRVDSVMDFIKKQGAIEVIGSYQQLADDSINANDRASANKYLSEAGEFIKLSKISDASNYTLNFFDRTLNLHGEYISKKISADAVMAELNNCFLYLKNKNIQEAYLFCEMAKAHADLWIRFGSTDNTMEAIKAVSVLIQALLGSSHDPELIYIFGAKDFDKYIIDLAIEYFEKLIAKNNNERKFYYYCRTIALIKKANLNNSTSAKTLNLNDVAKGILKEFLEINGNRIKIHERNNVSAKFLGILSYAELTNRNYEKALSIALRASSLAPQHLWIKINIAHALLFMSRYEEAKNIYLGLNNYITLNNYMALNNYLSPGNKEPPKFFEREYHDKIRNDFLHFRWQGLNHPDIKKIKELLNDDSYEVIQRDTVG